MEHLTLIEVLAFLVAAAAQLSRMLAYTRPFWGRLPIGMQVWLFPAVPVVTAFGAALTGVRSWWDLLQITVVAGLMMLPGAPSNRSTAPLQVMKLDGTPSYRPPAKPDYEVPMSEPPSSVPPVGPVAMLLVLGLACLHATGCGPSRPPCDQAQMAMVVATCTAKSQDCVNHGIPQDQCPTLADCDKQIEKACHQ